MCELHQGFMHSSSLNSSPEMKRDLSPNLLPSSYLSVCAVTMCCGLPEGEPLSFHGHRAKGTGTCGLLSTARMGIRVLHRTCMLVLLFACWHRDSKRLNRVDFTEQSATDAQKASDFQEGKPSRSLEKQQRPARTECSYCNLLPFMMLFLGSLQPHTLTPDTQSLLTPMARQQKCLTQDFAAK